MLHLQQSQTQRGVIAGMELFKRIRRWAESWHSWPFRHISKALYWLRAHTYNRYHMLDMRSKENDYTWGWHDRSSLILFANMALLRDFIEKEHAFDCHVCWDSADEVKAKGQEDLYGMEENYDAHAAAKKEMLEIYEWWTKGRPAAHKKEDELLTAAYSDPLILTPIPGKPLCKVDFVETPELRALRNQCHEMELELEKKDKEMMHRLIEVSPYMWT